MPKSTDPSDKLDWVADEDKPASIPDFHATKDTFYVSQHISLVLDASSLIVNDEMYSARTGCGLSVVLTDCSQKTHQIPFYDILWAEIVNSQLVLEYTLMSTQDSIRPAKLTYTLKHTSSGPEPNEDPSIDLWIEALLKKVYPVDLNRQKRAKVLLNPFSGKGKTEKLYSQHVEPIFKASRWIIDVERTTRKEEGKEIVAMMDINAYDLVVVCSGDGLIHEVFNGLGSRSDARKALNTVPVAHIPCGTGNGASFNLNGTGSVSRATLAIIKGVPMPLDLISITQGEDRYLSFLSQALGMTAETDLATEHMRWIGSARFFLGFFTRLLQKTVYPADIAVKVAIGDKDAIRHHYNICRKSQSAENEKLIMKAANIQMGEQKSDLPDEFDQGLPELKYGTINDDVPDWEKISYDHLGSLYCGNMAYVGEDAQFFPAAMPSDGYMDLVCLNGNINRRESIRQLDAVYKKTFFGRDSVEYKKVLAYRITPRNQPRGFISIDGESVPFEPFQAEIHKGLGRVISKNGMVYENSGAELYIVHK